MRPMLLTGLLAIPLAAGATDLEELAYEGYSIIERTRVDGEFPGCAPGRRIPLRNGMVFVCAELHVAHGGPPDVVIVKHVHDGDIRVLIDEAEYRGTLHPAGPAR